MASRKLSEEEIEQLRIEATSAIPYSDEEMDTLDKPDYDPLRSRAALARKFLKMYGISLKENSEVSD